METKPDVGRRGHDEPPAFARQNDEMNLVDDCAAYFRKYARERPETMALACLGVGFILGWKLKPW